MIYLKFGRTLTVVVTVLALFIISCEQLAIDNPAQQNTIEETAMLSSHPLVDVIVEDQNFQDFLNGSSTEGLDQEERGSAFLEYLDNVLFVKYLELAEMQKDDALDIVFQAVSQMDIVELRGCGCYSNCHFCCGMAVFGNRAVKQCFKQFCGFKRLCN